MPLLLQKVVVGSQPSVSRVKGMHLGCCGDGTVMGLDCLGDHTVIPISKNDTDSYTYQ